MGRQAPQKLPNVQEEVRRLLDARFYYETGHAQLRMRQLGVSGAEVHYVLKNGLREPGRDEYDWEGETWKYVIHGKPEGEERVLRIAFAIRKVSPLPNEYAVVITVIRI